MSSQRADNRNVGAVEILAVVGVLGSLWGLSEVLVNAGIRMAGLPARAAILTGVGMLAMGVAVGFGRRAVAILVLPLLAIAVKQLAVPLLGTTFPCGANSCLAIGLQGTALAAGYGLFARTTRRGVGGNALIGGGAALAAAAPFYFIGLGLAPCNYLLSFARPGGFASFMLVEGLVWAAFSAVLFPAGAILGERLRRPVAELCAARPAGFYGALTAACAACWTIAAITIVTVN